jgi:hypothetical protein
MSRLGVLEHGHTPDQKAEIEELRAELGFVSDVRLMLMYRPELFGQPFSEALQEVMREDSEWTIAERELFAAFVSAQNQCPF